MTTPSQFDPLAEAPRSIRDRIVRKFGRAVEPLAVSLLSWCRSLDHRVETVEKRVEAGESHFRAMADAVRNAEMIVSSLATAVESLTDSLSRKVKDLETRADQAYWGREALVERLNKDDNREEQIVNRLGALEERTEELYWSRSALVERMNRGDAVVEAIDRSVAALQSKVDEQLPLPLSFGLDHLAMGRRLAAIEDQLEKILAQPPSRALVAFPPPEKAAG
ncbi:MAG TPA: hypothetical protein VGH33_02125 [Isosphaeraceae bacterium]|jgi:chromosome segregation ATPase